MTMKEYCLSLIDKIPCEVYVIALIIFCVGMVIVFVAKGFKKGLRCLAALLLFDYIYMVLGSTVFFREVGTVREYEYTPFWSYVAIYNGEGPNLLPENIMNVVVFVSIGLLVGMAFRRMNWYMAMTIGIGLSVSIELMQLIFMRGFSELDDVMHNSFGCMIGYYIFVLYKRLIRYGKRFSFDHHVIEG